VIRFGGPSDVARMFRKVPRLLLALGRALLWLVTILFVLSLPLGLILVLVPLLIGGIRLLIWWYPRRGGRRRKAIPGAMPIGPRGALRYESWPSG